jgi:hypothetical protein
MKKIGPHGKCSPYWREVISYRLASDNARIMIHDVVPLIEHISLATVNYLGRECFPHAHSRDRTESFLFRGPGKDGALPSYMHIRLRRTLAVKYVPTVEFQSFRFCPEFTLPLTHFSSSFPAAYSPFALHCTLAFLIPHEEYCQYARHRHAHQRSCYACACGNAHRLFRQ